jgi:hypothetical protein
MQAIAQRDIMFRAVGDKQLADSLDLSGKTLTLPSSISANVTGNLTGMASSVADGSITLAKLVSAVQQMLLPSGAVSAFAMSAAPDGWLECNGGLVSRTTYAALFSAINTTYGVGDGSTTFTLPDFRGEFLRGWDNGRGVDASRSLGTFQDQDWKGFWMTNTVQNGTGYAHNDVYMGKSLLSYIGNLFCGAWATPSGAFGTKWDSSEIRPRNRAVMFCIKT